MMLLDKSKVKNNIEKRIYADVESGRVGGATVCVKQAGEIVYENSFGSAGEGRELTQSTLFRLASMTKPITGVAIMKQIERGLISLDDPLEKFIPAYGEMEIGAVDVEGKIIIKGKAEGKIKILHLLTHTSGVACGDLGGKLGSKLSKEDFTNLKSVTDAYAKLPISFEPYTAQAYSGTVGFDLLARVVEITGGMPYNEFVKKEIFEPLEMADTTFTPSAKQWDRMICMHNFVDGKAVFYPVSRDRIFGDYPLTYFCGGAGLASTVSDYMRFADMLLGNGKGTNGAVILNESSVKQMRTVAVPDHVMPGSQKWGLTMRVITDDSYKRLPTNAYGWSGAYGTHFWVDPDNQITAVYMKNSHYDGGSGALTAARFEEDVYL
ncbi:MAG: beta-lactamase family protein [Clostridia bacterium]|nr:beta-lactamase family protein [Clostridia bacterium]